MIYAVALIFIFVLGLYAMALGTNRADRPIFLAGRGFVTFIGFLLLSFSIENSVAWVYFRTPTPQQATMKVATYTVAKVVAYFLSNHTSFPVQINQDISLIEIKSSENRLIYVELISAANSEQFLNQTEAFRADMMKNGCQNQNYVTLMRYGLAIEIDYRIPYSIAADPIILTPEMCGY